MRVFPRIVRPTIKAQGRRVRGLRPHLSALAALPLLELSLYGAALLFLLTGSRIAYLERLSGRANALVLLTLFCAAVLFHHLFARHVRTAFVRRFGPPTYDDRRILLDLNEAARAATSIEELYDFIAGMIRAALRAEDVSLFVRAEATGDFICRVSAQRPAGGDEPATQSSPASSPASPGQTIKLKRHAFVITRLRHLVFPLHIEPEDLTTWMQALSSASRQAQAARAEECAVLRQLQTCLLLPIKVKEQMVGVLSVGRGQTARAYSAQDRQLLQSVAGQLALIIENAKLVERMAEEELLRRELALAAEVQQRLFPTHPPASAALELAGFCRPARAVGGDYYDFLALADGRIGVAIADVAGKGMSAALLMSMVQAALRSQALTNNRAACDGGALAAQVSALNHLLCGSTGAASYVTFFYAEFEPQTHSLRYINAGHNAPLLISRAPTVMNGAEGCIKLARGGAVIGLFEHFEYEEASVELQSGDLLAAYTDGVTEALNAAAEEFGEERLLAALRTHTELPAELIRDHVVACIDEWSAGAPQHDDLTLVILKVK
ncbi:MAG TPA: GAF domain-containing SpoIIE family protein phosphatase [Pyrinomonadaceae bacterium]|jgi:sigma-B regulation protein RsbU (phosphoserine phosphatase)